MRSIIEIQSDSTFWKNIDLLKSLTGVEDSIFASALDLNLENFIFRKVNNQKIPFVSVAKFASKIGISFEHLVSQELKQDDLKLALSLSYRFKIPSEYRKGSNSRAFTLRNILILANEKKLLPLVCDRFRLSQVLSLSCSEELVSVQMLSDILDFIDSLSPVSTEEYASLGGMNAKIARDLILKAHPDGLSSENLCELFFENIIQIESNWTYEIIRRNSGQMVVNSYPREELIDIHKRKDYSSESFLRFRAAVAQSFFDPLKRNGCKVKILRSVHLGDPYCRFSIDLPRQ